MLPQHSTMQKASTVRFANFLSPLLEETYAFIAQYAGSRAGLSGVLRTGESLEEFTDGRADAGFLCGLLYVQMREQRDCPVELLAAPVLAGKRYREQPVYFSDVIVRYDSPYTSFDELHGCAWAYNERTSHSGCNLLCYSLLERGKRPDFLGRTLCSGSHLNSLHMVIAGQADAAAIDSHILDTALRRDSSLSQKIRVVDVLGPSPIPPIVVAKNLDPALRRILQTALLTMHMDAPVAQELGKGGIARFVPVTDEMYDLLRAMLTRVQKTLFPFA
jgi:phosphonate transport system substrate-binding protein